jgi:hypothetical protein
VKINLWRKPSAFLERRDGRLPGIKQKLSSLFILLGWSSAKVPFPLLVLVWSPFFCLLVSWFDYSVLKMEVMCCSETSVSKLMLSALLKNNL